VRGPRLRLLLVVLVLGCLALALLDRGGPSSPLAALRRGTDTVFGPVQRSVGGAVGSAGRALGALPRIGSYRADNERLQRENDDLRRRLLEQGGAQAEGRELSELLAQKDAAGLTTVLARVVGYGGFQPFEQTVTLDVGRMDGVREGLTVTAGRGLVGRTVRVGERTTVVALLTDPTFSVGARLDPEPRSFGLARGQGERALAFRLVELADGAALRVDAALVTAGSDTFVPGVPVGRVSSVDAAAGGSVRSASVEPFVDLGALDLVQVVTEGPRTTPRVPAPPR